MRHDPTLDSPDRAKFRNSIIEKIRKLSRMTTASGCSEAEAETAIKMLNKLTADFNIDTTELQLKIDAQGMIEDIFAFPVGAEGSNWTKYLDEVIKMNDVRMYFKKTTDSELLGFPIPVVEVHVFGYPLDVSAAIATVQIVQGAMKTSRLRYKPNMKAAEVTAFQDGFADRIRERLRDMRRLKKTAAAGSFGNTQSLVVVKDKLVEDEWSKFCREKGLRFGQVEISRVSGNAIGAGRMAANSVGLGGTSMASPAKRISNG